MHDASENRVAIGHVRRPHGKMGELRVAPTDSFPPSLSKVYLCADDVTKEVDVLSFRYHQECVLLHVRGIDTRDEAATYRGWTVEVPRDELPELPDDTFYLSDLIGFTVRDLTGEYLGEVIDLHPTGGVEILVVAREGHQWMLPAAKAFVVEVDVDEEQIVVQLPEGLLDLSC